LITFVARVAGVLLFVEAEKRWPSSNKHALEEEKPSAMHSNEKDGVKEE